MLKEFKLPELAENVTSATVVKIHVKPGGAVKKDQTLFELENEKAAFDLPAPFDGVIKEILAREGATVRVGQAVLKIETGSTAVNQPEEKKEPPRGQKPQEKQITDPVEPAPAAKEKEIFAAPSVRGLAREIGVDLTMVTPTGPDGRISLEDVKAYAKQRLTAEPGGAGQTSGGPAYFEPLPDFSPWGATERKAMSEVRKKTSQHLTFAWQTIPHVTQFGEADITELEKLRRQYSTEKLKLTVTPFIMKILAAALKNFPQFNASLDIMRSEIVYKKYFHIGVAVDTERGLLVPVIRDVDKKGIFDLARELTDLARRARDRKLDIKEMRGACMSLTNLGSIGGTAFTPIVNWPEVAVLGLSRAQWQAYCADAGVCRPRFILPLSLSYDHRLIDGADGARFMKWITQAIEQPFLLEMGESK